MTLIKDIKTPHWSLSIEKSGEIVTDLDDINQCIYIIITTVKGTDRMRPEFGCGIFQYLDKPVSTVVPLMAKSVKDSLQIWEPRITVTKVSVKLSELSHVDVEVEWEKTVGESFNSGSTVVSYNSTNSSSDKIEYSDEYSEEYY